MAEEQIAPASPLPWTVWSSEDFADTGLVAVRDGGQEPVADALLTSDARYIVQCANAYPQLVAALQVALSSIEQGLPYVASEEDYVAVAERTVRAALALAEGR
jgi:hypothetical protein